MVPHLGPLKWKRSYLILKRYCVPNQKEGGLRVSLASGWCAQPLPKLLVREKKSKKALPETLNLLGPVLSRGFHFCNSLLGLLSGCRTWCFFLQGYIKKLWGQSRNPNHQGHWLVLTEREPWGEGVQFGIWTPNLCRRCFLSAANSDFISKLSWAELF